MPLYEYKCKACAHQFERIVKFSDAPLTICPQCGRNQIEQLISAPAIQFKGSGWYVNDYARKSAPASSSDSGNATAMEKSVDAVSTGKDSGNGKGAATAPAASESSSGSKSSSASGSGNGNGSSSGKNAASSADSKSGAKGTKSTAAK